MGMKQIIKPVEVKARRCDDGVWSLIVERCPYCGGKHLHGGGGGECPIYGTRGAHCGNEGLGMSYELMPPGAGGG